MGAGAWSGHGRGMVGSFPRLGFDAVVFLREAVAVW